MSAILVDDKEIRRRVLRTERESIGRRIYVNVVLVIVGLAFLFPIAWMLIISFKSQTQITAMPPDLFSSFTLENYQSVLNIGATYRNAANASLMQIKSSEFLGGLINTGIVAFFQWQFRRLWVYPQRMDFLDTRVPSRNNSLSLFSVFVLFPSFS